MTFSYAIVRSITLAIALVAPLYVYSATTTHDTKNVSASTVTQVQQESTLTKEQAQSSTKTGSVVTKPATDEAKPNESAAKKEDTASPAQPATPAASHPSPANALQHLQTKEDLDKALQTPGPKIFKFYAHWCNPCKAIEKDITKLAAKYSDKIKIYALDSDNPAFRAFGQQHAVTGLPTVLFLPSRNKLCGVRSLDEYEKAFIDEIRNIEVR